MGTEEKNKFSEDDLKSLRGLQEKYFQIQQKLGNVKITRLNLEKQLDELNGVEKSIENDYLLLKEDEVKIVDDFTEKYGQGSLDTKTGLFTKQD
jgi:5-bromo-4-chloroindolyl phosphate hydrolysis protein